MADGSPLTWGASLVRNLLRVVDGLPYCIPYVLGLILAATDAEQRRLGDRVAKTLVVKKAT